MGARRPHTSESGSRTATLASKAAASHCGAIKPDGTPCRAYAGPSGYCAFHNPKTAAAFRKGRVAGGRERMRPRATTPADEPMPDLTDTAAVNAYLGRLIGKVERGLLDSRIATAVAGLVNLLQKGIASSEQIQRIEAIERAVAALPVDQADAFAPDLAAVRSAVGDLQ